MSRNGRGKSGRQFLALNPAGELPVLELDNGLVLCGAYSISEFMAEELTASIRRRVAPCELFPGNREDRAEVRRLVDWFHGKFDREVTRELLFEKVYARLMVRPEPTRPDLKFCARCAPICAIIWATSAISPISAAGWPATR